MSAFEVGQLADRLTDGYYAHLAVLEVAAHPRAVELAPPITGGRLSSGIGGSLAELIYTPLTYSIKNGRKVAPYAQADHYDHVHAATFDTGGYLLPGWTLAYNGTGHAERVERAARARPVENGPITIQFGDFNFGDFHFGPSATRGDVRDFARSLRDELRREFSAMAHDLPRERLFTR